MFMVQNLPEITVSYVEQWNKRRLMKKEVEHLSDYVIDPMAFLNLCMI